MNQILSTNNQNNDKNNQQKDYYTKNIKNNNGNNKNKSIIIIFSIIILVFGLTAGGVGVYKYFKKNIELNIKKPIVTMEEVDSGVAINVSNESGIQMVSYNWNNQDSIKANVNNSSVYSTIAKPIGGDNTLNVTVIDSNEKEYEYSNVFSYEENEPTIEYNIAEDENGEKIIKVLASDDTAISYISYKWNEEDETKIEAEDMQKKLETSIQIKRGENKLIIVAVDTLGNKIEKDDIPPIKGIKKPEVLVKQNGNVITMTITHDIGIRKIVFDLNGVNFTYDENSQGYDSTLTKIEYTYDLQEGENTIKIDAYSMEETDNTEDAEFKYTGICQYQQ